MLVSTSTISSAVLHAVHRLNYAPCMHFICMAPKSVLAVLHGLPFNRPECIAHMRSICGSPLLHAARATTLFLYAWPISAEAGSHCAQRLFVYTARQLLPNAGADNACAFKGHALCRELIGRTAPTLRRIHMRVSAASEAARSTPAVSPCTIFASRCLFQIAGCFLKQTAHAVLITSSGCVVSTTSASASK